MRRKQKIVSASLATMLLVLPSLSYADSIHDVFNNLDDFLSYYATQPEPPPKDANALSQSLIGDNMAGGIGTAVINSSVTLDPQMLLVTQFAKAQLGKTYRYGATGPEEFDCSGLLYYVFDLAGKKIPRTSQTQGDGGVLVKREELKPGDLVFFDTRNTDNLSDIKIDLEDTLSLFATGSVQSNEFSPSKITHSGVYIGEGKFIHASSGSVMKVVIEELNSKYFDQRYIHAKRY